MPNTLMDEQRSSGHESDRRSFLVRMAAVVGSLGLVRAGSGYASEVPVKTEAAGARTTRSTAERVGDLSASRFAAYPRPTWSPAGYQSSRVVSRVPNGFRTGAHELVLIFTSPRGNLHAPLTVFVTPVVEGVSRELVGSYGRIGEEVDIGGGRKATYFDGMWKADKSGNHVFVNGARGSWTKDYTHSAITKAGNFLIGVKAPVAGNRGITREELLRVAASVGF